MTTRNEGKFWKNTTVTLLGMFMALAAQAHVINTNSTRFRDQNDNGCHMSPGAAGAPASGAARAGGNQSKCVPCQSDSGQSDSGISRRWVDEPWENLHLSDQPLSYFTSSGQPMVFRWLYKQRYKLPDVDEVPNLYDPNRSRLYYISNPYQLYMRSYGMTNASWGHNWMMDVLFWDSRWEYLPQGNLAGQQQGGTPVFSDGYEALVFRPEGGVEYFSTNSSQVILADPVSQAGLQPVAGIGYPLVSTNWPTSDANGIYWGDAGMGLKLVYPDGSQDVLGLTYFPNGTFAGAPVGSNSTAHALLTQRVDPQGRVTRVGYEWTA